MGSSNSAPRSVAIENPKPKYTYGSMEVTGDVINRLHNSKINSFYGNDFEQRRVETMSNNLQETSEALMLKKSKEMEANHYAKTLARFDEVINWTNNINTDLTKLRTELIKCYMDSANHALSCSHIANKFQNLIFAEQYKAILEHHAAQRSITSNSEPNMEIY